MPYTNQNTVLGSLDKLNQFLSVEVAKKENQDKLDKVSNASQQILSQFQALGPNAKPADLQKVYLQSLNIGAKNKVLKDIAPIASAAYTSTLQATQATKKANDFAKFKNYAMDEAGWANLGSVPANLIPQAISVARNNLVKTTEYRDDGSHLVIHKLGDGFNNNKIIGDFFLGDKNKNDLKNYDAKRAIDYKYNLGLILAKGQTKNGSKNGSAKPSDYKGLIESTNAQMRAIAPTLIASIGGPQAWLDETGYDISKLNANEQVALLKTTLNNPGLLEKIYKNGNNPIDYQGAGSINDAVGVMQYGDSKYQIGDNGVQRPGTLVPIKDRQLFEQFANAEQTNKLAQSQYTNAVLPDINKARVQSMAYDRVEKQIDNAVQSWDTLPEGFKKGLERTIRYISKDNKRTPQAIWSAMSASQRKNVAYLATK